MVAVISGIRLPMKVKRHFLNSSQNGSCDHFVHRAGSHLIHFLGAARRYQSVINLDAMESVLTFVASQAKLGIQRLSRPHQPVVKTSKPINQPLFKDL